jgi:hypothetical protein
VRFGSPLDVQYDRRNEWDADQLKAYGAATIISLKDYLKREYWGSPSYSLNRALDNIEHSTYDLYLLDKAGHDFYSSDQSRRLNVVVQFICEVTNLLEATRPPPPLVRLRVREDQVGPTLYDQIAEMMFEIIFDAAKVSGPSDNCWTIHHNMVWGEFFGIGEKGKAWDVVRFKLRRLLYDEIVRMDKFVNYKSARILGYCLNVMGLSIQPGKTAYGQDYRALKRAVVNWTKRNYLRICTANPDVADACLIGSIGFDPQGMRLVKTYAKGLEREPHREYLELDAASPSAVSSDGLANATTNIEAQIVAERAKL